MKDRKGKLIIGLIALFIGISAVFLGNVLLKKDRLADVVSTDASQAMVTITTARVLNDSDLARLKAPDTIDDNPISRWAEQRLGIKQVNMWVLADEASLENKVRLALSGDEALPDVLFLNNHVLPQLLEEIAASGRFMNVEEAFERYASPRLKEAYARNPDVWRTVQLDSKTWGLPQFSDGKIGDPILWIRQDWLDTLGLPVPTTLTELVEVMDAFTHQDPDQDGEDNTYGLALAGKNSLNGWMGDASFLFGAYGNQTSQWNRMSDGSLAYGSVQPEVGEALEQLSHWYQKGYLHPHFGTQDENAAAALFTDGHAGIISGPGWMGGWPLSDSVKSNSRITSVYKPIPFPTGPSGKLGRRGSEISYGSYIFRKDFKHIEAVFRYYDATYSYLIEDPESDFAIGFAEGYDYMMQNGEAIYDFPGVTSVVTQHFLVSPGNVPPGIIQGKSLEQRVYNGHVNTPYERRLAATSSRLFLEGQIVSDSQLQIAQRNEFLGIPSSTMRAKWPALQKMEKEAFLKIVYGTESPATFAAFVQNWRDAGGDEITREVNAWDKENRHDGG